LAANAGKAHSTPPKLTSLQRWKVDGAGPPPRAAAIRPTLSVQAIPRAAWASATLRWLLSVSTAPAGSTFFYHAQQAPLDALAHRVGVHTQLPGRLLMAHSVIQQRLQLLNHVRFENPGPASFPRREEGLAARPA
jgi:hypothetical protein